MLRRALLLTSLAATLWSVASAAPMTGEARTTVQRLANAAGVTLRPADLAGDTATSKVAAAFRTAGKCLTESSLVELQNNPTDGSVLALVILELRCVTTVNNGEKLTPELANGLLFNAGFDVNQQTDVARLLDNPLPTNVLVAASRRPVTPRCPRPLPPPARGNPRGVPPQCRGA